MSKQLVFNLRRAAAFDTEPTPAHNSHKSKSRSTSSHCKASWTDNVKTFMSLASGAAKGHIV